MKIPFIAWPLLAALAVAREVPRALPVEEAPAAPDFSNVDKVISRSEQFRVIGGDSFARGSLAILAEETKANLLRLTEEKDGWKVPVTITLHGNPGDPMPKRTVAMKLFFNETGFDLRMDLHLSRGVEPAVVEEAVTAALLYERSLRGKPAEESETPLMAPPWLVDGLAEANAWRLGRSDRRLYEALFKRGGLYKIDEILAVNDAEKDALDAAMRAAFRVSSGALVMALLEQPQGKDGFRAFLGEAASFEGEMPALLRKHFPELNLSETSLAKWWALQLANKGTLDLTAVNTIAETETALTESLHLNFRSADGMIVQKEIGAWPELAALKEAERIEAVKFAQEALVRLSFRCFPSYRPLLEEYQIALGSMAKNKTAKVAAQLAELDESRAIMMAKANRARDFLDWFEITRARETSGAFDDYLRLKDRLKANPHRRGDDLSRYLDRMDGIFHRDADDSASGAALAPGR